MGIHMKNLKERAKRISSLYFDEAGEAHMNVFEEQRNPIYMLTSLGEQIGEIDLSDVELDDSFSFAMKAIIEQKRTKMVPCTLILSFPELEKLLFLAKKAQGILNS